MIGDDIYTYDKVIKHVELGKTIVNIQPIMADNVKNELKKQKKDYTVEPDEDNWPNTIVQVEKFYPYKVISTNKTII